MRKNMEIRYTLNQMGTRNMEKAVRMYTVSRRKRMSNRLKGLSKSSKVEVNANVHWDIRM